MEKKLLKKISGTKLGIFITNKNYYNWSQYKNYKWGGQKVIKQNKLCKTDITK